MGVGYREERFAIMGSNSHSPHCNINNLLAQAP
jgi:hypothetical protein